MVFAAAVGFRCEERKKENVLLATASVGTLQYATPDVGHVSRVTHCPEKERNGSELK